MKDIFKKFDITGSDYTLYRDKKKKSSSTIGGCISILSSIIISFIVYTKITDFTSKKIINTSYSNYRVPGDEFDIKSISYTAEQNPKIFEVKTYNMEMYKYYRFVAFFGNKTYILPKCGYRRDNNCTACLDIDEIDKIGKIDKYELLSYLNSIMLFSCRTIVNNFKLENKEELDDCTGDEIDFHNKYKNETINMMIKNSKYYYNLNQKDFYLDHDQYIVPKIWRKSGIKIKYGFYRS
jgi:hypothetical protein